jgi:hypothetical protein
MDAKGGRPEAGHSGRPARFAASEQAINLLLGRLPEKGRALPAKTVRQRQAERRRQKLESMKEQIEAGTLTIRQMTPAERQRHPPPERPRPRRSWM